VTRSWPPAPRRQRGRLLAVAVAALAALTACQRSREEPAPGGPPKPLVIATFYPLYEFARQVGGDGIEVAALVPPGIEPHHWEPAPSDLLRLQRARVFVYNGAGLEPWVDRLLGEILPKEVVRVRATDGLPLAEADLPLHHGRGHRAGASRSGARALDPHVWLDPRLAAAQVEVIAAALVQADPARAAEYTAKRGVRPPYPESRSGPRVEDARRPWWPRRPTDSLGEPPSPWQSPDEPFRATGGPLPGPDGLVCWPHGDHVHCRRAP
jgi:Zinc-uptake complex component A periplasmic